MKTAMISTRDCEFVSKHKVLRVPSEKFAGGFPSIITVMSHHTGKVIDFKVDVEAAIAAESWDGEMCEYVPTEKVANVNRLVVYHAY